MSTRATYTIDGKHFYVHHDGYPEGAAAKFYLMLQAIGEITGTVGRCKNSGGYAENFIRGNDGAEFTESPELHGDRDYHYTIKGKHIRAVATNPDNQRLVFDGDLGGFIAKYNKYLSPNESVTEWKNRLTTVENLIAVYKDTIRTLGVWATNGHTRGANWDSVTAQAVEIKKHLASCGTSTFSI